MPRGKGPSAVEQTRGPDRLEENLAVVMMQVRRSVRAALREAAQSEGLSQNEIEVLLFLAKGRYDTARDISRQRGMPRSLVSKSVDLLLKRGYLQASPDARDRRVARLRLLPPAQATVDRLVLAKEAFFSQLCRGITREEAEAFYSMVGKLTRNLNECPLADEPEDPKG